MGPGAAPIMGGARLIIAKNSYSQSDAPATPPGRFFILSAGK